MTNLTTLASVKQWLGSSAAANDDRLTALIAQASGAILAYLNRSDVVRRTYTEKFTGSRSQNRLLREYPVLSVTGLTVCGASIPAGDANGYWLDPADDAPPGRMQKLNLTGYSFGPGLCQVTYAAGYFIAGEVKSAAANASVSAPYGPWAADGGVTKNGSAMTAVAASPAQGQYSVSQGVYTFNAADYGQTVLISYSYIPAALQQACNQIVAEQIKYAERIGIRSQSLGGQETISYNLSAMPSYVQMALAPFRRMVPV